MLHALGLRGTRKTSSDTSGHPLTPNRRVYVAAVIGADPMAEERLVEDHRTWIRYVFGIGSGPKEGLMRKLSVVVGATALALAGAGWSWQSSTTTTRSKSSTTTRATAIAAPAAVSWGGPVNAPTARSIVGTWTGHITPFPGSGVSRRQFMIVVARGERGGTWRIGLRCAGTLRLKDISGGYHHYYRVAGANAECAALGVDCLKRVGAQMVDVFVPDSGPDDSVNLRRR